MTVQEIDDFWKQPPTPDEKSLHGDVLMQWLNDHPRKCDRPPAKADILDEVIEMLELIDKRYGRARSSHKGDKNKRYKSLKDSYDHWQTKFDREQAMMKRDAIKSAQQSGQK